MPFSVSSRLHFFLHEGQGEWEKKKEGCLAEAEACSSDW